MNPEHAESNTDDELDALDARAEALIAALEADDPAGDEDDATKAANYGARMGQVIAGRLTRGTGGRFSASGAAPASAASPATLRGGGGKGKGRPAKPGTVPKPTPEQRKAEKEQAKAETRRANEAKVGGAAGLGASLSDALMEFASPDEAIQLSPENAEALINAGLVERDGDGKERMTPAGRAYAAAARRGDVARARDALSIGKDRAKAVAARQQARAERDKAKADKEQAKGKGGKGGGGKAEQPTPEQQQAEARQAVAQEMAAQDAGLTGPALDTLLAFADGGEGDPAILEALVAETGLVEVDQQGEYRLSREGRAFARAANQGDTRGALDALSKARDRRASEQEQQPMGEAKGFYTDNEHPGVMLAFLLDDATRAALLEAAGLEGDEDAQADHLTLVYLTPDASNLDGAKNKLVSELALFATATAPLTGVVNGYGRFVGEDDDGDALWAHPDCPNLPAVRQRLVDLCVSCGVSFVNTHGFTPHITLTYLDGGDATPDLDIPRLPLRFDRVALVWAGETLTFPLLGEPAALATVNAVQLGATGEVLPVDDTMIYPGSPVKALGEGRIGGYLVVFGDPKATDLAGDFFTKDTDFGFRPGERIKTVVWFNHRLPLKTRHGSPLIVKERIGEGWLSLDGQGVFVEAVLDNRKQYEALLDQLGWSSGTAAHLVDREPAGPGGRAMKITRWLLGLDASLTPTPAEPRTRAIPLKSYIPPEVALEGSPEAATAAAAVKATTGALTIRNTSRKEFPVDRDELKAMLDEALKGLQTSVEARVDALSGAVDARLKAFEDAPALKNSGFISMDGGAADKNVKSFADWLLAVKRRDTKRLTTVYKSAWTVFDGDGQAIKDLSEGSGPAGGYLVPVEYEPQLQRISAESAIVEPRARKITMGSATKMVPMLKQTANPSTADGGSAFFGGLVFYWNPEGSDISTDKTDPAWDMIELIARKLTGLTVSSNELTEDAPALESELTQLFGEGLAHAKDFFYLRGNGVGKPLGVLNAPARYQLTRKASGNHVEMEDVSGLMARMLPGSMSNAIWVSHPLNISDIIQLKIGDTPVFQPDAKGPVAGTLLGRPIAFSEYAPAPGSAGDFGLYDFQAYAVGVRRGITIASSEHARFDNDQTTWRITYRGDGQPLLDSTVKLADGSNTEVSPFAVLN